MATVLVTGGGGFLGSFVVSQLRERGAELGVAKVKVLDVLSGVRGMTKDDDAEFKARCVDAWVVGSITDDEALRRAVDGVDAIVHVASAVETGTADPAVLRAVNVDGTRALLAAAQAPWSKVRAVVYASSLDVLVANIFADVDGETEDSLPYAVDAAPASHVERDVYSVTKTTAERDVLACNGSRGRLLTAAVRPVGLFGPRDVVHLQAVLSTARQAGSMHVFRIGAGDKVFQHAYVENVAWMLCLCAARLLQGDRAVAGQAFMGIDDTKVCNFFDFFTVYLAALGYRVPTVHVPAALAWPAACLAEDCFRVARWLMPQRLRGAQLLFTRRAVHGTCVTQWFDTDKARRLLGYVPPVPPRLAHERTLAHVTAHYPRGPFVYPAGAFDTVSDDDDFRPSHPLYLAAVPHNKHRWRVLVLAAFGMALVVRFKVA